MGKIYVGDIGTAIVLDCGEDISSYLTLSIKGRKPDDSTFEWPGSINGTNNVAYLTQALDLDQEGVYKLQAYVTTATGSWLGETVNIEVFRAFN
jgi:hypothetical protein